MSSKYSRTHKKLIRCGMELLFAGSFRSVSVSAICQKAGVSRPTFYLHFKCKEQLIAEYYSSAYFFSEEMQKWITSAPDEWISVVRMQILYIQHTCNADHADLISRYLSYQLTLNTQGNMLQVSSEMEDMLLSLIRRLQEKRIIRNPSDPYYLCKSVFMLHTGNLFNWCANGGKFDRYSDFFWSLEAILSVDDNYRGLWKLEENFTSAFYTDAKG